MSVSAVFHVALTLTLSCSQATPSCAALACHMRWRRRSSTAVSNGCTGIFGRPCVTSGFGRRRSTETRHTSCTKTSEFHTAIQCTARFAPPPSLQTSTACVKATGSLSAPETSQSISWRGGRAIFSAPSLSLLMRMLPSNMLSFRAPNKLAGGCPLTR